MNNELVEMEKRAHTLSRRLAKLKCNADALMRLLEHVNNERDYFQDEFDTLVDRIYEMKWEKVGT